MNLSKALFLVALITLNVLLVLGMISYLCVKFFAYVPLLILLIIGRVVVANNITDV